MQSVNIFSFGWKTQKSKNSLKKSSRREKRNLNQGGKASMRSEKGGRKKKKTAGRAGKLLLPMRPGLPPAKRAKKRRKRKVPRPRKTGKSLHQQRIFRVKWHWETRMTERKAEVPPDSQPWQREIATRERTNALMSSQEMVVFFIVIGHKKRALRSYPCPGWKRHVN